MGLESPLKSPPSDGSVPARGARIWRYCQDCLPRLAPAFFLYWAASAALDSDLNVPLCGSVHLVVIRIFQLGMLLWAPMIVLCLWRGIALFAVGTALTGDQKLVRIVWVMCFWSAVITDIAVWKVTSDKRQTVPGVLAPHVFCAKYLESLKSGLFLHSGDSCMLMDFALPSVALSPSKGCVGARPSLIFNSTDARGTAGPG
jgi:hypothetical protein